MTTTEHILLVDDNREMLDLTGRFLRRHGLRVSAAQNGQELRKTLNNGKVDLIVLDVMMPGDDGLTLCREIRAASSVPIIMLTAMGEDTDRIVGLEMGADDYMTKPFNPRELLARIKAVLRRARGLPDPRLSGVSGTVRFEGWRFDTDKRQLISDDDVAVPLSTGEHDMLLAFVTHPQKVLSREQLMDLAKGRGSVVYDRSIDTQVSRLRRKLEIDPKNPEIIKTVWGGGYVFVPSITYE